MKNKLLLAVTIFFLTNISLFGQKDTTKITGWIPKAIAGLNISQLSLSNWTQGGENSLTWTITGNLGYNYQSDDWNLSNNLKLAYGRTKLGGQEIRTNDNEFYLESVLSKNIDWILDPFFSNIITTSIAPGFNYNGNQSIEISNFFDPGYVVQSAGFEYNKLAGFKTRLGLGLQEVFTNQNRQYTDDPTTTKVEAFKLEIGLQSVTSGNVLIAENLMLNSSLTLFTRFKNLDVWDVRWDNSIVAKVNSWLNVNIGFLLIYQKDQSLTTQMKQTLQLGVVYTLF